jgi:CHRD domain
MTGPRRFVRRSLCFGVSAVAILAAGCAGMPKDQGTLSGSQEVPPVTTNASGNTNLSVLESRCPGAGSSRNCPTLYGSVLINGVNATAAHVHMAPAGKNGPVVAPLVKVSDTVWAIHSPTTLTEDQFDAYLEGKLYVNVHSAAHPDGEIRAQLRR